MINDCSHFRVNHVTEFNQNRNWLRINPEQGFDEEKPLQAPQDTKKESIKLSLAINRVPPILNPAISRLKLVLPRSRLPGNGSVKPDLIATTSAKRARRRCRPAPSSSGRSEFLIIDVNFCSESQRHRHPTALGLVPGRISRNKRSPIPFNEMG